MSLTSRFTELPSRVSVPPSTVENDRGKSTLEGEMPRRWHQFSITGSSDATTGVLGTIPETGAITNAIRAISRRGDRMRSEAIKARSRSSAPLLNSAAETGNSPIKVIRAGLPKPASASGGVSTPVAISSPRLRSPVSSGARAPLTNSPTASTSTARVIRASGACSALISSTIRAAARPSLAPILPWDQRTDPSTSL